MRKVVINNQVSRVVGLSPGPQGPAGPVGPAGPAGQGFAAGGAQGQLLQKASASDYDTQWVDAPSVAPEVILVPDNVVFTVAQIHNGGVLWINQTTDIDFTLPDTLDEDFQVSILGYTTNDITFTVQGTDTLAPVGYSFTGESGIPVALALVYKASVWTVIGPETANTVTVVYDSGWPATRPNAIHVFAVGHTSAPSWLTAADVWLEDVS